MVIDMASPLTDRSSRYSCRVQRVFTIHHWERKEKHDACSDEIFICQNSCKCELTAACQRLLGQPQTGTGAAQDRRSEREPPTNLKYTITELLDQDLDTFFPP